MYMFTIPLAQEGRKSLVAVGFQSGEKDLASSPFERGRFGSLKLRGKECERKNDSKQAISLELKRVLHLTMFFIVKARVFRSINHLMMIFIAKVEGWPLLGDKRDFNDVFHC
ncbi:hypothetical protein J2Z66_002238 [Paenibacillus eucommiae]|uniref:Uncharacterized protein n=1 Tax=Paenibacillus eucommiae TaxID=1355755 RepID=A0ABS4IST2_9BACL|nr:hypothetical protein [Paenibacillus eucommiae]